MRFTTKGGLKLDVSEVKSLKKARDVLAGILKHATENEAVVSAAEGIRALEGIVEHFTPPVTKELPISPAESDALADEQHEKSRA